MAYDLFQAFWQYGYTTPLHNAEVQYSDNYDASYERRFKGTDMSIKVTPYFRYATNQVYSIGLPFGLSGGLNSGVERVAGFETEFTKGDFSKNGLSFLISYTYTNAAERWNSFPGTSINPIDPYNQDIANFNGLTRARVTSSRTPSASNSSAAIIRRSGTRITRCRRNRFSLVTAGIPSASITPIYRRTF